MGSSPLSLDVPFGAPWRSVAGQRRFVDAEQQRRARHVKDSGVKPGQ
ncbi:MAG: hypothetical protein RJA10_3993 [Pseudomonadota bacterium]|jgi:hypothetical protein